MRKEFELEPGRYQLLGDTRKRMGLIAGSVVESYLCGDIALTSLMTALPLGEMNLLRELAAKHGVLIA